MESVVAKETIVEEYKESAAYSADLVDGNVEATEIGFTCFYNRLACDHSTMDLSCYTLIELLEASTLKDDTPSACPSTLSPSDLNCSEILPVILEDRPLKAVKEEVGAKLDPFGEKLNEVLTLMEGHLRRGDHYGSG